MMRSDALFVNGVFEGVLQEIVAVQSQLPEQILYLQPYSESRIVELAENPPSVDVPVRLFASLTTDLNTVHYVAEVVGWDNKQELSAPRLEQLNRIIRSLQPGEGGVYETAGPENRKCTNLLHVRRLKRLPKPFSVVLLTKVNDGKPVSPNRETSGGWAYVWNPEEAWLREYL